MPWSGTITAPITSSTNGSEVSARSALTQSVGRLKVGIPTATLATPGAGSVAIPAGAAARSTFDVGGDVEPDPAAVLERIETDLELGEPRTTPSST